MPVVTEGAEQNQVRHAVRMLGGIGNRNRASGSVAEQRDLLQVEAVDQQLEQRDLRDQRKILAGAIGQAAAERIVANYGMMPRKTLIEGSNRRDFPFEIEMAYPRRCPHDHGSAAYR